MCTACYTPIWKRAKKLKSGSRAKYLTCLGFAVLQIQSPFSFRECQPMNSYGVIGGRGVPVVAVAGRCFTRQGNECCGGDSEGCWDVNEWTWTLGYKVSVRFWDLLIPNCVEATYINLTSPHTFSPCWGRASLLQPLVFLFICLYIYVVAWAHPSTLTPREGLGCSCARVRAR